MSKIVREKIKMSLLMFLQTNTKDIGTKRVGRNSRRSRPLSKRSGNNNRMIGRHAKIKERLDKTQGRRCRTKDTKKLKGTLHR